MSETVSWLFEVDIKEGQLDNLRALIHEMAERTQATEPDTLTYQWSISEDGSTGQVHEQYTNSDAALAHLATFNETFADRLMAMADPRRMTIYGNASAALKDEVSGIDPTYMNLVGGFARTSAS